MNITNNSDVVMTGAELVEAYSRGQHNFENVDFIDTTLTDVDLSHATFEGVTFINATLRGVDLSGAKMNGCNFSGAQLKDCDLSWNQWSGVVAASANIVNCRLYDSSFTGSDLSGSLIAHSLMRLLRLEDCDLSDSRIEGCNATSLYFHTWCNLSGTKISNTDLRNAYIWSAVTDAQTVISSCNVGNVTLPEGMVYRQAWVGGPRHRTAAVWYHNGLHIDAGCISVNSLDEFEYAFDRKRGEGWSTADVDAALASVAEAVEAVQQ